MVADTDQLRQLTGRLLKLSKKMAVAESCTGGGLAERLTRLPGSSAWFECGFVTYSNASKTALLNVNPETLAVNGAVSEETAHEMVIGAMRNNHAQIGISVTGIAGPGGGSPEKPVGMVCFAWYLDEDNIKTARVVFKGDRQSIRAQSCSFALKVLLDELETMSG